MAARVTTVPGRLLALPARVRVALASAYAASLTWVLLAPSDTFDGVELFPYADKVVHAAVFLGLACVSRWAAAPRVRSTARGAVLAAALVAYAAGIEALQPVLTGGDRQFEWLDMAGNHLGIAAGWLLFGAAAGGAAVPAGGGGAGR